MATIYLVDDHTIMRDGLRAVLEASGHSVIGESDNPTRAAADMRRINPDVLLLDLNLGQRSGFELLAEIQQRASLTRTIVLTMSAQPRHVVEALRMGAMGYLLKGASANELAMAINAVMQDRRYLGGDVADISVEHGGRAPPDEVAAVRALSMRERQVVLLVVRGKSSSQIGDLMHLSPKTVDSYRSRLMAKLGVADVPALVRLAIRVGMIDADEG